MTNQEERQYFVRFVFIGFVVACLVLCYVSLFSGCHRKKKPESIVASPPPSAVIYADTTRAGQVHRASKQDVAIQILNERTQSTLKTYEKADSAYHAVHVQLPRVDQPRPK